MSALANLSWVTRTLRDHPGAVESDLSQYHNIDIRDRWVFDEYGRRKLTLHMIFVRLWHLPHDSATKIALGSNGWSIGDYLLADNFHAATGNPHPARPKPEQSNGADRAKAVARARKRKAERDRQLASGEIPNG